MSFKCREEGCKGEAHMKGGWCDEHKEKLAPRVDKSKHTVEEIRARIDQIAREQRLANPSEEPVEQFDINNLSQKDLDDLFGGD